MRGSDCPHCCVKLLFRFRVPDNCGRSRVGSCDGICGGVQVWIIQLECEAGDLYHYLKGQWVDKEDPCLNDLKFMGHLRGEFSYLAPLLCRSLLQGSQSNRYFHGTPTVARFQNQIGQSLFFKILLTPSVKAALRRQGLGGIFSERRNNWSTPWHPPAQGRGKSGRVTVPTLQYL